VAFSGVQFEVAELPERETPRCQLPPFCVSTFGDGLLNHLDQNGWEKKLFLGPGPIDWKCFNSEK